jgi:chromosome segregation ATPase
VIQSVLFFVLGFLSAGFLALMIAPAVWRRAVRLTRKRVEASVPLSLEEIQADKDRLRAEFAASTRRLEMSAKQAREKAAEHAVQVERDRETLNTLEAARADLDKRHCELDTKVVALKGELRERADDVTHLAGKLREAEATLEARGREFERISGLYDEATLAIAARQVELLSQTNEVERLTAELNRWRAERRDVEKRVHDAQSEMREAQDAARSEKKKAADLENKVAQMLTTLADHEETIQRREKDLMQSHDRLKASAMTENDLNARLTKTMDEKARLEAQVADLSQQISKLMDEAKEGEEDAVLKLSAERRRLDERLIAMTRENQKLRGELSARDSASAEEDMIGGRDRQLRDQISELAAQVLAMTSVLEGQDSPVTKALEAAQDAGTGEQPTTSVISLADRVRALKSASSTPN